MVKNDLESSKRVSMSQNDANQTERHTFANQKKSSNQSNLISNLIEILIEDLQLKIKLKNISEKNEQNQNRAVADGKHICESLEKSYLPTSQHSNVDNTDKVNANQIAENTNSLNCNDNIDKRKIDDKGKAFIQALRQLLKAYETTLFFKLVVIKKVCKTKQARAVLKTILPLLVLGALSQLLVLGALSQLLVLGALSQLLVLGALSQLLVLGALSQLLDLAALPQTKIPMKLMEKENTLIANDFKHTDQKQKSVNEKYTKKLFQAIKFEQYPFSYSAIYAFQETQSFSSESISVLSIVMLHVIKQEPSFNVNWPANIFQDARDKGFSEESFFVCTVVMLKIVKQEPSLDNHIN